jgi:hypothetical protein
MNNDAKRGIPVSRRRPAALDNLLFCVLLGASSLWISVGKADEVGVAGQPMTVSKQDCQAMATYRTPKGVDYQPGVDVHGKPVAPADAPGGFTYNLPAKIEFDITINPIGYAQRNALQQQIAGVQAKLGQNPNDTTSQAQLASLQGQLAAISGKYDNTAASVGHVVVDTHTGQATLNGRPMQDSQEQYIADLCRKAGY